VRGLATLTTLGVSDQTNFATAVVDSKRKVQFIKTLSNGFINKTNAWLQQKFNDILSSDQL
jgi:hypothetical protein